MKHNKQEEVFETSCFAMVHGENTSIVHNEIGKYLQSAGFLWRLKKDKKNHVLHDFLSSVAVTQSQSRDRVGTAPGDLF